MGVGNFATLRSEKEDRIDHLQLNIYHMVQRLWKSVQWILRYFRSVRTNLVQNITGCHGNVPWGIAKTGPDQENSRKYLPFGEKTVKISPVDTEIDLLIFKKIKKKEETRNAWQSLAYSPLGATMSPPSRYCLNITMLPPGERKYTYPITDRCLFYTVELWWYWSEAHQIYNRGSLIIARIVHKVFPLFIMFIDRVAGAIIRLVTSVCVSVRLWALSCLNRLTFDLDLRHESRPRPWLTWDCRSRS